jgi:hypothetical protein
MLRVKETVGVADVTPVSKIEVGKLSGVLADWEDIEVGVGWNGVEWVSEGLGAPSVDIFVSVSNISDLQEVRQQTIVIKQ